MMPRPDRTESGISLLELLLSMFLFGILTASVGLLLRNGLEYLRNSEVRTDLSRQSLSVLSGISRELTESHADSIRLSVPGTSDPPGLVFASPRGAGGDLTFLNGHVEWKRWVSVHWDQTAKHLIRKSEDLAAPTAFIPDPSPGGLNRSVLALATNANAPRLLANNITNFEVTGKKQISMRLEAQAGKGDRVFKLTTQTLVVPKQ